MSSDEASRVAFRATVLIVGGLAAAFVVYAALGIPVLGGPPWTVSSVLRLLVGGAIAVVLFVHHVVRSFRSDD